MKNNLCQQITGEASPAQKRAIIHASGPMQVLAGPGAGKTYLMIRRIRHLICHHGISPDRILVITFTKAAALEMKERFARLTMNGYSSVSFGTFHAVYYQILRSVGKTRNWLLISPKEKKEYMKHCLSMCRIEDADDDTFNKLFHEISRLKNSDDPQKQELYSVGLPTETDTEEDDLMEKYFPYIYEEYNRIMRGNRKLDFDDRSEERRVGKECRL